jgi:hypothetical protein
LAMKDVSLVKMAQLMGNSPEIAWRHYINLMPEAMRADVGFCGRSGCRENTVAVESLLQLPRSAESDRGSDRVADYNLRVYPCEDPLSAEHSANPDPRRQCEASRQQVQLISRTRESFMTQKRLNILVAGGIDPSKQEFDRPVEEIADFARCIGGQIIRQGHTLLGGCSSELDASAAAGAAEVASELASDEQLKTEKPRIRSWVQKGKQPVHKHGSIMSSDLDDWGIDTLEPSPPELVRYADVVILIGGSQGTKQAANWARLTKKPLLPLASFGGTAKHVYKIESSEARFEQAYGSTVDRLDYEEVLNSLETDWPRLAADTVSLAERIFTTPNVFVIMSFASSGEYKDLYAAIKRVCSDKKFNYDAKRVDESNLNKRIIPEIHRQVRQCAFVIADVTEQNPNVFYELGFADGLAKEVILVAKKGTELPFDINDVPVLFWDSFTDFEEQLRKRVAEIGQWQGRG